MSDSPAKIYVFVFVFDSTGLKHSATHGQSQFRALLGVSVSQLQQISKVILRLKVSENDLKRLRLARVLIWWPRQRKIAR